MFIDRHINEQQYKFDGEFFIKGEPMPSKEGDLFDTDTLSANSSLIWANGKIAVASPDNGETIVLKKKCDVTEKQGVFSSGAITASYDVYYPLEPDEKINIDRGYMFRANVNGVDIVGMVVSVGYSALGGVHAYIKSTEV